MIIQGKPKFFNSKILAIDSRQIQNPADSLFIAIKGINHDGHQYIEELYHKGVREFIVEQKGWTNDLQEKSKNWERVSVFIVENSIQTLQEIAKEHRDKFHFPVIAITGSNGKTTVKEWLSQILEDQYSVVKSPKSFNSQVGVPLSVWKINQNHSFGIFEAGISKPNEMNALETIIQPTGGIFTNLGSSHGANFDNDLEKLKEKLNLFKKANFLIFHETKGLKTHIKNYLEPINPNIQLIYWSESDINAPVFVYKKNQKGKIHVRFKKSTESEIFLKLDLPDYDEASIENLINCVLLANQYNISQEVIQRKLINLRPISMRLEMKDGLNGNKIIDDTYNNDLEGLQFALSLMKENQRKNTLIILSEMIETGMKEEELYEKIGQTINQYSIQKFIGIGKTFEKYQAYFKDLEIYKNTEDYLENGGLKNIHDSLILIKGARKYQFERIVNRLLKKTHQTELIINLNSLKNNLDYFKEKIGPHTKIMAMVKAFAYGAGSEQLAKTLEKQSVDYFAVAYTDEGIELRENGIYAPIMVLNPQIHEFDKLTEYNLEPEIYSLEILKEIDEYSTQNNKNLKIHLKIDTGMKRLGFETHEIDEVINILNQAPQLWVASIFSHLVASEDIKQKSFTEKQIKDFKEISNKISENLGYKPLYHINNSAGINNFSEANFDMIRLGIGLFGISSNPNVKKNLEEVLELKTYITQIKTVEKEETIGYGRKGKLKEKGKIATLGIGYADGFRRNLGLGKGQFLINGKICKTVGNICMDMCMVDISHLKDVQVGDQAIAFSKELSIQKIAELGETIPYEIMTSISPRVKRTYLID
ncbi:MAG: hypothetical protein RIR51_1464 [Bacteroidota bacterium]|jgi:alanine racemase